MERRAKGRGKMLSSVSSTTLSLNVHSYGFGFRLEHNSANMYHIGLAATRGLVVQIANTSMMSGLKPLALIEKVAVAIARGCIIAIRMDDHGPHSLLHEQDGIRRRIESYPGEHTLS